LNSNQLLSFINKTIYTLMAKIARSEVPYLKS